MMRSMYSAIQGLQAHQLKMDAIGNNIANVNTIGYKAQRVTFASAYAQTLQGASAPTAGRGGINGQQIGMGATVGSIDSLMSQGSMQATGQGTDMAISGNGFFVLKDGGKFLYTRAGNFDFDTQGYMVSKLTGQRVQGWLPDATGAFPTRDVSTLTDVAIPLTDKSLAKPTGLVKFDQALNALAPVATPPAVTHQTSVKVYDSLGMEHILDVAFTKTGTNDWTIDVTSADTNLTVTPGTGNPASIHFNPDGSLDYAAATITPPAPYELSFDVNTGFYTGGTGAQTVRFDLSKITQVAMSGVNNQSTVRAFEQDGFEAGDLQSFMVDNTGMITASYTNGQTKQVGQVALATFANPAGLVRGEASNWSESPNSGMARFGEAGSADRGKIASTKLEMSNVDLSSEFTDMIVTQRGFQANSRTITTADEMLQELVNLKR